MDRSSQLGRDNIPRLLFAFSLPAIAGVTAQGCYNVVDRIFVGQALGPLGIASITVAFPFMLILMGVGMLTGMGAATLVSVGLGEGKRRVAEQVLGNGLILMVALSLILTVAGGTLLDPLLELSGASPSVLPYAREYLQIIVIGSVFQVVGFGLSAVIRAQGSPRVAMLTILLGAALNVILTPMFIFGLGWGMKGAATATVVSQAVSAFVAIGYFRTGRGLLRLRRKHLRLNCRRSLSILAIGSPPFAMQLSASLVNGLLNRQLRTYGGDLAISVMGILYVVVTMIGMPIVGINQGSQPIISYNYGAQNLDRVRKTLQTAILAATSVALLGFTVTMVFPWQILQLFHRQNMALGELGSHAMRVCLMMLPVAGFQVVGAHYFQAVGKPWPAMLLMLSKQVLLLIPAVLILPHFWGLGGVWAAIPTADAGSAVLTAIWLGVERQSSYQGNRQADKLTR